VRGVLEIVALGAGKLAVVNEVPLESYLAGTLGREMYGSWSSAALRAQAVASRTYAVEQINSSRSQQWHMRADTQSQVYGGVAAESASVSAAVEATRGEILTHRGRPILAVFHSSAGGRTASAEEVWGERREYLISVPVEDEWESPDTYWRATVSGTTLGRAVAAAAESVAGARDVGVIQRAEVIERTGSGRAARVRLHGERGPVTLTGRSLRSALGESTLRSTLFELHESDGRFVFVGSGRGHGVGMSQWGARAMARRGIGYREILRTFYPGASFRELQGRELKGRELRNAPRAPEVSADGGPR
jgi:stage II sporulation protein D